MTRFPVLAMRCASEACPSARGEAAKLFRTSSGQEKLRARRNRRMGKNERRKKKGSGTPKDADPYPPHPAVRLAPCGAFACRRSTTALARGTPVPKAQLQARLPGT